jgi:predicted TIM-barrel fold metal-dependent hydrolase
LSVESEVPFPPNPNPGRPKFATPQGSWDTHFHVFGPPHRYPYAETRRYSPPAAPIEHWLEIAAAIGISRGIVVTPNVHDLDPTVTLDAIAKADGRLHGVIRADRDLTPERVRVLHAGGIRGLRFPFAKFVGRAFDASQVYNNVHLIEPLGWFAEFQIDDDELERHAELIGGLQVTVVIDQFGGIDPSRGVDQTAFRTLLDLLGHDNIWLKLICPDRYLNAGVKYQDIVAMSQAAIRKAPDRMIWGTDWPHPYIYKARMMPDDAALLDMLADFAPDQAEREDILVRNPCRLLRIKE